MRLRSLLHRRPSPAIAISVTALFLSLGGVGYAATQLPRNSVGNSQIQNGAVSFTKIRPNTVGRVRANVSQLQERVTGKCAASSAIGTIDKSGKVTCNTALPTQVGTTNNTVTVPSTQTMVISAALPTGASYLALANPTASVVSGANQRHVTVSCTLTVGSNTETRQLTVNTTGNVGDVSSASMPLQATGPSGTASVNCQSSATGSAMAPPVTVTAAINAISIAG
jgi:hypothetical protein